MKSSARATAPTAPTAAWHASGGGGGRATLQMATEPPFWPADATYVRPEPALPPAPGQGGGGPVLTAAQVEQWRTTGALVVSNVWPVRSRPRPC